MDKGVVDNYQPQPLVAEVLNKSVKLFPSNFLGLLTANEKLIVGLKNTES